MAQLTPTTVWRTTPELLRALDDRLGPPLDRYVNGTQTWLTPDGPAEATLEWRLHPVAGFRCPAGITHDDLWETVLDGSAIAIAPTSLWDGLECFPAYGDELEPATLARCVTDALGLAPDAAGLVDHERIGRAWEKAQGDLSLVDALLAELTTTPEGTT